jgi:hypothetical protein
VIVCVLASNVSCRSLLGGMSAICVLALDVSFVSPWAFTAVCVLASDVSCLSSWGYVSRLCFGFGYQ